MNSLTTITHPGFPPDYWSNPYGGILPPPRSVCEVIFDALVVSHSAQDKAVRDSHNRMLLKELQAAQNVAKRISVTLTKEPDHPFNS